MLEQTNKTKPAFNAPVKTLSKVVAPKVLVPQFHYPAGKPEDKPFKDDTETMKTISAEFRLQKESKMYKEQFAEVVKLIGLPKYWKSLVFKACTQFNKLSYVTYQNFEQVINFNNFNN